MSIAADASGDASHKLARTRQAEAERQAPSRSVTNLRGGSGEPPQAKSRSADLLRGGTGKAKQTEQDSSRPSSATAKGPKVGTLLSQVTHETLRAEVVHIEEMISCKSPPTDVL